MGGLCGCVKRSVKLFYFIVCKIVIKADQKSSFYPSINDILYQKYLKKRQCHCNNVALSEPAKTIKKARISHSKVWHPVSSFAPRISGLHTSDRKQVVNNDFLASQPCTTECTAARFSQRLYSESSQTTFAQLWSWYIYLTSWMDCSDELFRYSTHDCVWPVRLFFIRVNASSSLV